MGTKQFPDSYDFGSREGEIDVGDSQGESVPNPHSCAGDITEKWRRKFATMQDMQRAPPHIHASLTLSVV